MIETPDNGASGDGENAPQPKKLITFATAKRYFTESVAATAENDELCMRDARFYHGDQLDDAHRKRLAERGQPPVLVPRIQSAINGVLGLVDASETAPECLPNDPDDQNAADIGTKVLRSLAQQGDMDRTMRVASEDKFTYGTCAVIVGEGAQTGDSKFGIDPVLWEDFVYDPQSRYHDFSDARWLGVAKWVDPAVIAAMYPEAYAELGSPQGTGSGFLEPKDTNWRFKMWVDCERKLLRVVELYILDEQQEWQRVVFCEAGLLDQSVSIYKDDNGNSICPIVAVSFQVNRMTGDRYGPVRQAIELQQEFNSRRSKLLHVTNSRQVQITDANADPAEKDLAREQAALPNGVIPLGYAPIPTQDIFQGNAELLAQTERDFDRLFPTPAVLGRMQGVESGRAFQLLQQAGYTEWSRTFQRLEAFQKQIYRRLWFLAKQFMTAQDAVRITNEVRAPVFAHINVPQVQMRVMSVVDPQTNQPVMDPMTGQPRMAPQSVVVGVKNEIAKMDLDVTLVTVPKTDTLPEEVWAETLRYAGSLQMSPLAPEFEALLQIAPIPDKTKLLERLRAIRTELQQQAMQAAAPQQQAAQQQQALHDAEAQSKAAKNAAQARKAEADAQKTSFETQAAIRDHSLMHALLASNLPPTHPPQFPS